MSYQEFLNYVPWLVVSVSTLAAVLILLIDRPVMSEWKRNFRDVISFIAAVIKFTLVCSMLPAVLSGDVIETAPIYIAQDIPLYFKVDAFGLLFALLSSSLWIATSVYAVGYMRALKYGHEAGFYATFALSLAAATGIAMSGNLLTFFIFFEILTVATYPLVVHNRDKDAIRSAREYLIYLLIAGQALLVAVVWTHLLAPGASFTPGGFLADTGASKTVLTILFVLFILGVGVKAAIIPFHGWLPSAMVAPTPVSALLHAVAVVKAGAFGVTRVTGYVFGPELVWELGVGAILAVFAGVTIIFASLKALTEQHLKRRIAYSTVSQLSYIVLGAALSTPAAILGAMFHIVAHGFMKITMFFCAGAIYATSHKEYVYQIDGIARKMPFTMGAFALAAIAITGMPFMVGFISKWNLGIGALEAGFPIYVAVLIISAALNVGYFFPIVYKAFFNKEKEPTSEKEKKYANHGEADWKMLYPLIATAVFAFIFGILPNLGVHFYDLAVMAAEEVSSGFNDLLTKGDVN